MYAACPHADVLNSKTGAKELVGLLDILNF